MTPRLADLADSRPSRRHIFLTRPRVLVGGILIAIWLCGALLADVLAPYPPLEPHYSNRLAPPDAQFLLGTDELGRDLFSRILYGSRISLTVGIVAEGIAASIGLCVGMLAGWFGGWIDDLLMRVAEVFFAIPALMFLIVWVTILESTPLLIFIGLGLISWAGLSRVMRAQVLALKSMEFVIAARSIGVSSWGIMYRHILPNAIGPVLVLIPLGIGGAILSESILSFLGLGITIPYPSWGSLVDTSRNYFITAWWYAVFPGAAISLAVLGFSLLSEGLMNP